MPAPRWIAVAEVASLPPGEGRSVQVGRRCFALWNVDGVFHALDDACPHKGAPLGAGTLHEGTVFCPLHGWAFDVRTGACHGNPRKAVQTHATRVADGQVWLAVPADEVPGAPA
jgi:nitrite reductase (NADH) small subunit/3-phenylpropionate/trans-cinnamate dioxygenase ferredoxin subunit